MDGYITSKYNSIISKNWRLFSYSPFSPRHIGCNKTTRVRYVQLSRVLLPRHGWQKAREKTFF